MIPGAQGMAKPKTAFVCNACGADYSKWQGQCSECGAWNTLAEIRLSAGTRSAKSNVAHNSAARSGFAGMTSSVQKLADIDLVELPRFSSGFAELDRVLGGGLVQAQQFSWVGIGVRENRRCFYGPVSAFCR